MPVIADTAYPRLSTHPPPGELEAAFTPTAAEIAFAARCTRQPVPCLALLVLLKTFQRLGYFPMLAAFAVMARLHTVFADKGYDAERNRALCRAFGAEPHIHKRGQPHGSGLGQRRWPVERSHAWVLENKRLALRYDRRAFIVQSFLQAACIFLVAGRVAGQL